VRFALLCRPGRRRAIRLRSQTLEREANSSGVPCGVFSSIENRMTLQVNPYPYRSCVVLLHVEYRKLPIRNRDN
jgi:hypothetical protein